jgi:hypothetical protein
MDFTERSVAYLCKGCIELFKQCQTIDAKASQRFENRLADFNLWADGVGAMANEDASLESRFGSRSDDLAVVKGVLAMLLEFLNDCLELSRSGRPITEAVDNIDLTLKDLAFLAVAIRQTGKRSRLKKAADTYDPKNSQDLKDLRAHLEFLLRNHLADGCLTPQQERLVEGNLRRRHWFLRAQDHSNTLETPKNIASLTGAVGSHRAMNTSKVPRNVQAPSPSHPARSTTSTNHKKPSGMLDDAMEIGGAASRASTADSTPMIFRSGGALASTSKPRGTSGITRITASTSYPSVKVAEHSIMFFCPCCCQVLHAQDAKGDQWR